MNLDKVRKLKQQIQDGNPGTLCVATWTCDDGQTLLVTPFYALDDADAKDAGISMVPLLPVGGRVRITDLVVGYWDEACFSTRQNRLLFDSQDEPDCELGCGCPCCTLKAS